MLTVTLYNIQPISRDRNHSRNRTVLTNFKRQTDYVKQPYTQTHRTEHTVIHTLCTTDLSGRRSWYFSVCPSLSGCSFSLYCGWCLFTVLCGPISILRDGPQPAKWLVPLCLFITLLQWLIFSLQGLGAKLSVVHKRQLITETKNTASLTVACFVSAMRSLVFSKLCWIDERGLTKHFWISHILGLHCRNWWN